ncbi:unnamed protein product, partial [Strongylus vulgaris]
LYSRGELGIGLIPRVTELTWLEALEGIHVTRIAAAGWHSAALTGDGDVYVWGWNHRGQLGDEKYYDQEPDKKTEEILASDAQVDMVFINRREERALQEGYGEFEYPVRDKD